METHSNPMHNTAHKRKHAALIRITARERNDEDLQLTLAYADTLEAEADLDDAIAGVEPAIADHADVKQIVPILGQVIYSGGIIKSTEYEWTTKQDSEANRQGIMLAWSWVRSLYSDQAGQCVDFFAGTRESGPLVHWSTRDGYWRRCQSNGNFGKNWAYGGTWSIHPLISDQAPDGGIPYRSHYVFNSLQDCNPILNQAIASIMFSPSENNKLHLTKATRESAQLRPQSIANHQQEVQCQRQESRPIANTSQSQNEDKTHESTQQQIINQIMDSKTQEDRIRLANAKLQAARLRQDAAYRRLQAMHYRLHASPGRELVAASNAAISDAKADEFEARAELILAEAAA